MICNVLLVALGMIIFAVAVGTCMATLEDMHDKWTEFDDEDKKRFCDE